jgi:hypothetical protein
VRLTIQRGAPLLALAEMIGRDDLPALARKRGLDRFAIARIQATRGRSWAYRTPEGTCIACAGLFALPTLEDAPRRLEAWFACRRQARHHMPALLRATQLTLSAAVDDGNIEGSKIEVLARVNADWRPGQRIARALGFKLLSVEGGVETWVWTT